MYNTKDGETMAEKYRKLRVIHEMGIGRSKFVSIPKEFAEKLKLKGGDYVEVILKGNTIILKPLKLD